ncbi:hypothetical protein [Noviherbaspirillum pedocola]|uniref:Uncharacterized protein n=1 Tax=Noviherbaspirillum pedocola TaxID=2801341 RepID=A0A934W7B2_9BURK|nr:hypothetical protein [Noviherbaspirillum pedocola]MBK4737217.1 hypothetical protein [Noviherbaspirillum pedocola]
MASVITHHSVRIVTLEPGDTVATQGLPGDIILEDIGRGWITHFIDEDGTVESYEDPFDTYNKALGSAKAAAEYQASGE